MLALPPSAQTQRFVLYLLAALALSTPARAEFVPVAFPALKTITSVVTPTTPTKIALVVDHAVLLPLHTDIGTILLGNSRIADATLADGRMIILNGMTPGLTNMILLDTAGARFAEIELRVSSRKPGTITVRRAMETRSYDCLDAICEGDGTPVAPPTVSPSAVQN